MARLIDTTHPLADFPLPITWESYTYPGACSIFEALLGFSMELLGVEALAEARQRVQALDRAQAVALWIRVAERDVFSERYFIRRGGAAAYVDAETLEDA